MKNQKVSVDVWAMLKTMGSYLALALLGGVFLRLVITALTLPRRLRAQRENIQRAMDELKLKYPDAFENLDEEAEKVDGNKNECPAIKDVNQEPSSSTSPPLDKKKN